MLATCETTTAPSRRNGGAKGVCGAARALEHRHHPLHAAPGPALARDIDIRRARRFERKAHKLAAPLDARPIVELVRHNLILVRHGRGDSALARARPAQGLPGSRGSICGRMWSAALT